MASASTVKDQYHHAIPRFILRRFQVPAQVTVFLHGRKRRQFTQGSIYYYNLETREVELRSIATVYGSTNLYKDARNPNDVMELEKKLSALESNAARVISDIERTIGDARTVTLRRVDVEDLRRFLFIMHYRREALSLSYFQEDHPENAPTRAWMKAYRERFGLESAVDMWLHMLRYYLDEPHEQMLSDYFDIVKKHGPQMLLTAVDPSIKYEAMAYGAQAGSFFMSIWEAASGEEFVLGHNAFGLWEGLCAGQPGVHRIFVVSPRIAVVLRSHITSLQGPRSLCNSDLLDIPAAQADVRYHEDCSLSPQNIENDPEELIRYRQSAKARGDIFTFTKTNLTVSQTDTFNAVILRNVKPKGSLTFHSIQSTLRTLRSFDTGRDIENYLTKHMFHQLIETLAYPSLLPSTIKTPWSSPIANLARLSNPTQPSTIPQKRHSRPLFDFSGVMSSARPKAPTTAYSHQSSSNDHPLRNRLRELMYAELAGVSQFKSRYGTAYAIHKLCQHDEMPDSSFISEQRQSAEKVLHHIVHDFQPPPSSFQPRPENLLFRDLSNQEAEIFFAAFDTLFKVLGIREGDDWLSQLSRQVAMVGFVERLAQTRPDVYEHVTEPLPVQFLR